MSHFFALLLGATAMTLIFGMMPVWILVVLWVMFFVCLAGSAMGVGEE